MILTIKIQGGLGNQMFQYAYAKALALRTKHEYCLDISEYETYFRPFELVIFDINKKCALKNNLPWYISLKSSNKYINYICNKIQGFCKTVIPNHYREINFKFNDKLLYIPHGYIEGYFQSEKYFIDFSDMIRKDFVFVKETSLQNQKIIDLIQSSQSVSIHIRRGDYLKGNNLQYHGVCSIDYYQLAIQMMKDKLSNPRFFFFSDDIDWVKKNITTGNDNDIYVDHNTGDKSREDMRLMSLCKHNIIANSSFSRRGAWLNNYKDKIVVSPSVWFTTKNLDCSNIIPESRIKI